MGTELRCDGDLLQLMWLASPGLPVGGFSYSEGLEAAVEAGRITGESDVAGWLLDQLWLGLAAAELPLVLDAVTAWRSDDAARIEALNQWWFATRDTAEARRQTEQMGRSLAAWLPLRPGTNAARLATLAALHPAPCYPLGHALAAAATGATAADAALAYAFGWAEHMVQAAVKTLPLGQSAGQRILGALVDAIPDALAHAQALPAGDRCTSSLTTLAGLAILGARHETQYSRLFRS